MFQNMALTYTLPADLTMSLDQSLSAYALHREQVLYAGFFLIPITSLTIHPSLQRPADDSHIEACKLMYANNVDVRSMNPLECIVPLASENLVVDWVQQQDQEKLSKLKTADLLVMDIPGIQFPIIKGQHRFRAYSLVLEEDGVLPKDAPHPECLSVRLFYSGVCICYATFT
jgi:hypothetical protein